MAEDAWLQTPFATLASAPDSGLSWLLPRLIGVARAKRMLMRAERLDAATARDLGLVDEPAHTNQLRERRPAGATDFAVGAPLALGETHTLIYAQRDVWCQSVLRGGYAGGDSVIREK